MRIGFFEEFPDEKNLGRLRLIGFPIDLYIAAKSLSDFRKIRKQLLDKKSFGKKIRSIIYWPVLEEDEGYWMSPLSRRKALKRIIDELKNSKEKIKVLWDAEFPIKKENWKKELHNFLRNRILIRGFIKKASSYNKEIITAEYPLEGFFFRFLFRFMALSFNPKRFKHKKIGMVYTSMVQNRAVGHYLESQIAKGREEYGTSYCAGLGVIGKGILNNEKELTNRELKRDLGIAKKHRVGNVILYRLGGIDKKKADIIKKFLN
ncbi:hypothetical protein KY366_02880 [Candidatus Woesearchaeota archaeon]|nr:hypothetical protein [Candidatus Woesearchaeota archaeon]